MSAHIVEVHDVIKILLKRIENYTVNKQYGEGNIPHLCIKVKHNNGFAWFGVHILEAPAQNWSIEIRDQIEKEIQEGLNKICDIQELVTDMPRLMDSISDVVSSRKRPTIFGGMGNDLLQLHMEGNVQLDVYRNDRNPDTLSYGGFEGELMLNGRWYTFFLYHRGVILYNYIDSEIAVNMIRRALTRQFPEIFDEDDLDFVQVDRSVDRTRNKRREA
ncbi:hypothetical protein MZD04_gp384 [Pseudomonas phage Psa21]|uniref:Uncharacterized protein n=1 Tax=Pseudomonas phage Psa21 TaxID=2530023 RepID=A0A481W4Z9_9CAUD|nr:hypothetical protein MZD04_gp384 [Pseudomonas phage Psa21]QBJ02910.1 hypothetical protein PSA21_384 [Pseudomonas phage Psa21]